MKSPLPLLHLLVLCTLFSCNKDPKELVFEGLISQDDNFAISNSYNSKLTWTEIGGKIQGEGYYAVSTDTLTSALYSFDGEIDGDTIRLHETGIIYGADIEGEWLTKEITLYYIDENKEQLRGSWVAQRKRSAFGVMKYSKIDQN